jgi:UDP-N-acetylmuramate--alanine ligase
MADQVHFIGIGGVSMSGLAEILHTQGRRVTGSDAKSSGITEHLESLGIPVFIGHSAEHLEGGPDLVVHTAAVKSDNPELIAAREKNIPIIDRAELLGRLMRQFSRPICVSGTHGKTSTTSMITDILLAAGWDPTVSVGGFLDSIGGNFRMGGHDLFVVESCEYFDSFLKFTPYVGLILNVDRDHLDYFSSLEAIEESFCCFARSIPAAGCLVICARIPSLRKIIEGLPCRVLTYGDGGADICASDVCYDAEGFPSFTVLTRGGAIGRISLKARGEHNVLNALAACAAALTLGVPTELILAGLSRFSGVRRRFESKGEFRGVRVIDDYAHHPTEIKATLAAAQKAAHRQIWCVFQPHTFSRTQALMDEFSDSFADADRVAILDIYAAREKNTGLIHARQLADKIREKGKDVQYFSSFQEAKKYLEENCIPKDLLITMGAGDVYLLGESLLNAQLSTAPPPKTSRQKCSGQS